MAQEGGGMSYLQATRFLQAREIYEAIQRRPWVGPRWLLYVWMWRRRYRWDGQDWVYRMVR